MTQEKITKPISKYNYPDDFKRQVAEEYLKGAKSMAIVQEEFKLPSKSLIQYWVGQYKKNLQISPVISLPMTSQDEKDLEALKRRNAELEKALQYANLKIAGLETMINVAEKELQIKIGKKSGSKQSK